MPETDSDSLTTICLDFTNTVSRSDGEVEDDLATYPALLTWAVQAGLIGAAQAAALEAVATTHPAAAAEHLATAVVLRETIFRIFSAVAEGRQPTPSDLGAISAAFAQAAQFQCIEPTGDGYDWCWPETDDPHAALDRPIWPIILSATTLLTGPQRSRVRLCASPTCQWLFLDRSRNRSRRWCEMASCGNAAKARRYYARQRGSAAGD